ncbi:hypothetical protein LB505_012759 [Fusarium chuoi]|nr:hypothetical protein LB505_012759 [Fusarium chuoi]
MFFILPCTLSVAEMCAYLPIRGSIFELAGRFVDPALGFSMGWTYFYGGVMLVCVEYSAVATGILPSTQVYGLPWLWSSASC